jgi:uncharacterized membrane protein YfcA
MTCLLATSGACIGVLAGMLGAGPSILTILLLTRVAGLDLDHAIGTSLVVVALMSLVALGPYVREGAIVWRPAVTFGVASMTAAFLAGHLASLVPERALLLVFLASMIVAAVAMLVRRPSPERAMARTDGRSVAVLAGSGLLVGSLTGLIGLGGGFAVVPLLVLFARTPIRSAIGASLLVIAINTLAGLAGHLPHPPVDWRIAAYLGGTESIGSVLGCRLSRHLSSEVLRGAFASLMLVAAVVMLGHTFIR